MSEGSSRRRATDGCALALLSVCAGWLVLLWSWEPAYLALTVDDSFYYLQTARNLAEGHGSTFDQLNPTSGYHPLWLLILAALSWVTSAETPTLMRLALSLQLGCVAAGALALRPIATVGGRRVALAVALLLSNVYAAKTVINGQESALLFLLLALTLRRWWTARDRAGGAAGAFGLGALCGLCVLARVDAALFAAAVLLLFARDRARRRRGAARDIAAAAGGAALLVLPYLVANQVYFDHWVPISAAIKLGRPPVVSLAVAAAVVALLVSLAWSLARRLDDRSGGDWLGLVVFVFPLALYSALKTAAVGGPWPPGGVSMWYLAPELLLLALTLAGAAARLTSRSLAAAVALLYLAASVYAWNQRLDPASLAPATAKRRLAHWLRDHTEPDAIVAGWNVGIIGAHSERRTINLDGLINSWAYREHYLRPGRVAQFIDEVHRVDYLADHVRLDAARAQWAADRSVFPGIDVRDWYVAYLDLQFFRPAGRPDEARMNLHLVLSRDECDGCSLRVRDLAAAEKRPARGGRDR